MPRRPAPPPIPSPSLPLDDPDRVIDCELYLEPAFEELAEAAEAAGWSGDEIDSALISLARSRITRRVEDGKTDCIMERVKRAARQN
jgi:hypothetical protein